MAPAAPAAPAAVKATTTNGAWLMMMELPLHPTE